MLTIILNFWTLWLFDSYPVPAWQEWFLRSVVLITTAAVIVFSLVLVFWSVGLIWRLIQKMGKLEDDNGAPHFRRGKRGKK